MTPDAEDYLWEQIIGISNEGRSPREVIKEMVEWKLIASPKQAWRTLEKWLSKGWYDYGVNLDLGWKTKESRG
jgi:hypothetical protein